MEVWYHVQDRKFRMNISTFPFIPIKPDKVQSGSKTSDTHKQEDINEAFYQLHYLFSK